MKLSFVIPTYNRKGSILRTIDSILSQSEIPSSYEIIIVDDVSTDGTVELLFNKYKYELSEERIKIIVNNENVGVTGSKNAGYELAKGDWVIFLDSDDMLIADVLPKMLSEFRLENKSPIIFFRCMDQEHNFVGVKFPEKTLLNISSYVKNTSYGEALTCVNKNIVSDLPYVSKLRGYEGLGCARIILNHGPAVLSMIIARLYDTSGNDRLSSIKAFRGRALLLCYGHSLYFKEFKHYMSLDLKFKYLLKVVFYFQLGVFNKLASRLKRGIQ